jgi:hypothetical protein
MWDYSQETHTIKRTVLMWNKIPIYIGIGSPIYVEDPEIHPSKLRVSPHIFERYLMFSKLGGTFLNV